jgi:uncharacterized membrane protein HdeD (DUF308 family)
MDTTPRELLDRLRDRARLRARSRPGVWWWPLLVLGSGSVLVGAAMLVWPRLALGTIALVLGGWLLVTGVTRVVGALLDRSRPRDRQRMGALVGIACVAAGAVCLVDSAATLRLFGILVGLQWIIGGIGDVIDGLRDHRPGHGWLVALGGVSTLAGVGFVVWPAVSLVTFVLLAAGSAITIGVLDIAAGLRLRRLARG